MDALQLLGSFDEHGIWLSTAIVLLLPSAVLVLYLAWKKHPSYGSNPGLPLVPLLGSLPSILLNKHRFYEWTSDVLNSTPSLTCRSVICGLVNISTANPLNVQHILKTAFDLYPKGPDFYPYFSDLLGNGIFNCDGAVWRLQRKVASHEFTSNSLKDFVIEIADAELLQHLLPALRRACCGYSPSSSSSSSSSRAVLRPPTPAPGAEDLDSSPNMSVDARGHGYPVVPVDLQALILQFTFDTICKVTFGACRGGVASQFPREQVAVKDCPNHQGSQHSSTGFCSSPTSQRACISNGTTEAAIADGEKLAKNFQKAFEIALNATADRFLTPAFLWKAKRALSIGSERRLQESLPVIDKFTKAVIERSRRDLQYDKGVLRKDLLSRFMRLSRDTFLDNQEEPVSITDAFLKDILLSFLLAGRESVASGVTFLLWHLTWHPEVEKAVLDEINGIIKSRDPSAAKNVKTFTYDELRRMNYLHAALSESMRLYPPAPSDCKFAMKDDTWPDGRRIHKGYQVSYNVFAMGRAERLWGKDCLQFKPERWLGKDGEFVPESPYKYPVFQAGPRICLGKDFAYIEMKLLVASLLQEFEFSIMPDFKPQLSFGVNLTMLNGLPVFVKHRSPQPIYVD